MSAKHLKFYFCFRSPYAWIAARWLETYRGRFSIQYIPFWEPDAITTNLLTELGGRFIYTPMSREKHLYILQDLRRIITDLKWKLLWPVDRDPWWDLPHLGYLRAVQQGKGHEFLHAVYDARWEDGKDICSVDILTGISKNLGLDPELIVNSPYDASIRQEGAAALLQCYKDSVFGIPFFVCGREKYWGIDRFQQYIEKLEETHDKRVNNDDLLPQRKPASNSTANGTLFDHAGGCG